MTLDIRLSGWRGNTRKWFRAIEIPVTASLYSLHHAIQDAIDFDDDHMYEFYIGRAWNRRSEEIGEAASSVEPGGYDEITLADVFPLEKSRKLYYWFDFGDDWMFEITCRAETHDVIKKAKYPRIVEKNGRNPQQYPR